MLSGERASSAGGAGPVRPWIGVRFVCANRYVRVFRRPAGDAYIARCPTCGLTQRFVVGEGGAPQRFFEVTCRR